VFELLQNEHVRQAALPPRPAVPGLVVAASGRVFAALLMN
jgi:hypothetical protein